MPDRDDDLAGSLRTLAACVRRLFGVTAVGVEIRLAERPDAPIRLPFPPPAADGPRGDDERPLSKTEKRMLRTVRGMPEEDPTADEIAKAGRMQNDPYLRRLLSGLRKRGYLGGRTNDQGYPLTPKGDDAIEGDDG